MYYANCCFNSCAEQSHKDGVQKATAEEQLGSKTIDPSSNDSPAPSASSYRTEERSKGRRWSHIKPLWVAYKIRLHHYIVTNLSFGAPFTSYQHTLELEQKKTKTGLILGYRQQKKQKTALFIREDCLIRQEEERGSDLAQAKKIENGVCSVKGRRNKMDLFSEEKKKEDWICSAKKRRKKIGFA